MKLLSTLFRKKITSLDDFQKLDEASKRKLKVIKALKLFSGLVLLGFCIWWLVGIGIVYWSTRGIEGQFQKNLPVSSEAPVQEETANWKTYTNNDCDPAFGISFKYPSDWQYFEPEKDSLTYTSCGVLFKPVDAVIDAPFTLSVLYENEYQNHISKLKLIEKDQPTAQETETVSFAGISGMHFKDSVGGSYSLNKNGKALEFVYNIVDSVDYGLDVVNILSTLEFLEK